MTESGGQKRAKCEEDGMGLTVVARRMDIME